MSDAEQCPDLAVMRLDRRKFIAMNNPFQRIIQKHIEFATFNRFLEKRKISLHRKVILDMGCVSRYSSELILKAHGPSKLIAFDLMPEQISLTWKRNLTVDFSWEMQQTSGSAGRNAVQRLFSALCTIYPRGRRYWMRYHGFLNREVISLLRNRKHGSSRDLCWSRVWEMQGWIS